MLLGASASLMRVSSATPGYLNPGTQRGLAPITADGGIACTQDTETGYHGGEPAQVRKGGGLRGAFQGLEPAYSVEKLDVARTAKFGPT